MGKLANQQLTDQLRQIPSLEEQISGLKREVEKLRSNSLREVYIRHILTEEKKQACVRASQAEFDRDRLRERCSELSEQCAHNSADLADCKQATCTDLVWRTADERPTNVAVAVGLRSNTDATAH